MRFYAMVALLAAPAHPLAQRRLLGATKKKKKVKKQPPLPTLPQNAPPPPRPAVTPEVHMAIVEAAVAARAPAIRDALGAGSFFAAFMALWTLEAMAATATTARAAAAGRDGVSVAFLDFADFRATYASVFRSLGVADAAAVDACVALAAPYDLATHPPPRSQNHVHQHADDALREELGAVLASSVWWHDAAEAFEVALDGVDG